MKTAEITEYLVSWLEEYCRSHGRKGFVVGVSGGIDSSVTSTLCAATGLPTLVLSMPIYQAPDQHSLSQRHVQWLKEKYENVESVEIDLTDPFKSIEQTLPESIQNELSMANARARLRMLTLYAFASADGRVVAGTGNKVEDFGVGFFTKYGDGGVDISPIGDLLKSEVREVGRHLGILDDILNAPPTDGLWHDGRTDEQQLGATYEEIEWAMGFENGPGDENALDERQKEVLKLYRARNAENLHKMTEIPVAKIPEELK